MVPYSNVSVPIEISYLDKLFQLLNYNSTLSFVISSLLIFFSALVFNNICLKHQLIFIPSYLPAYFFVLLNSLFVDQFYAGPVLFVNLFIILSLGEILKLYKANNPTISIFIASLLAGVSSLLNISYLAFFIFVIIGINVFRPFSIKDNLAGVIGFLMPLYIGTMINFLINDTYLPFRLFYPDYGKINIQNWALISALPAFFMVGLFAVVRMYQNFFRNTTKAKRAIQMLLILLVISVILMITGKQNPRQEFSFVALPLAVYYSYYFSNFKFNLLKEIINLMLILTVLFFQYRVFFEF